MVVDTDQDHLFAFQLLGLLPAGGTARTGSADSPPVDCEIPCSCLDSYSVIAYRQFPQLCRMESFDVLKEDNELLTQTGRGTPMGTLLRRFWIPALLSSELPTPDSDPLRVTLLGENYVAFRDSSGNVGFLDEACPHRGASLALGRCEEGGIRCLYHGWKFDRDGKVLETPNLRDGSRFRERVSAPSFPCVEAAEIIWVYLGPAEHQPPVPNYAFMDAATENIAPMRVIVDANWVQVMESHHDSSHASILHHDYSPFRAGTRDEHLSFLKGSAALLSDDDSPSMQVEDTEFGFYEGALRNALADGEEVTFARIHAHVTPFLNLVPPNLFIFEVPIDDNRTSVVYCLYEEGVVMDRDVAAEIVCSGEHFDQNHFTGTAENRWGQDRSKLDQSYTGIGQLAAEDWAVVVSMGPVIDRTKEHLVAADAPIVHLRRQLIKAARDLEQGIEPPVLQFDLAKVRPLQATLRSEEDWREVLRQNDNVPPSAVTHAVSS